MPLSHVSGDEWGLEATASSLPASQRRPEKQVALLLANVPNITDALMQGSIVVFEETRLRIRSLPIGGRETAKQAR